MRGPMDSHCRRRLAPARSDEGAVLIVAMIFVMVVGLLISVALTKSGSVAKAGLDVREATQMQYAADSAADRALQILRSDLAKPTPTLCTGLTKPETPQDLGAAGYPFSLNGHSVTYTCETVQGSVARPDDSKNSNYAIVTTSQTANSLTFQGGTAITIDGAIYLGGTEANAALNKVITVTKGGVVEFDQGNFTACTNSLDALTQLKVSAGWTKVCGAQTPTEAIPHFSLPAAPANTNPAFSDVFAGTGKNPDVCRIFLPGRYTSVPDLVSGTGGSKSANYFVSGRYYFTYPGQWTIDNSSIIFGGQPNLTTNDLNAGTAPSATACAPLSGLSDAVAKTLLTATLAPGKLTGVDVWDHGTQFVLGGTSTIFVKKGEISLYRPTTTGGDAPVSFMTVRDDKWFSSGETRDSANYSAWHGAGNVLANDPNAKATFNGKVLAPDAPVSLSGKNQSVSVARSGLVGSTVDVDASGSVSPDQFSFQVFDDSTGNGVPPQRRTVRIVATATRNDGTSNVTATYVATIDNFGTRPIRVYSARVA